MAAYKNLKIKSTIMGKLSHGADLLDELTTVCKDNNIRLGRVWAIGAVQKARLGYYHQDTKKYSYFEIDKHLEITPLVGNISIRDGEPMVHAHVTLSADDGTTYGGHLAPGTIVFACEFVLDILDGAEYIRTHDETTGLQLWEI